MCSIFITKGFEIEEHRKLSQHVSIRGLDSSTTVFGEDLIFTHHRLPLQEFSQRQPTFDGSKYYWLVGELYEGYSGDEMMALNEMLERGLWFNDWEGTLFTYNESANILQIKVDPLRKRPVFYYQSGNRWIITNDFSFFRYAQGEPLDNVTLGIIQRNGFNYTSSTPLVNVKMFGPGNHVVNVSTNKFDFMELSAYNMRGVSGLADLKETLASKIRVATINRIKRASLTKQFGTYLSGGVDSTFLHAVINDVMVEGPEKIPAIILWNLCTDEEKANIDWLARSTSCFDFNDFQFEQRSIVDSIEDVIDWFYLPIDLGSVVAQIQLTKLTAGLREHGYPDLHVVLTGDGADEFFGGYRRNRDYDSRYYDMFVELIYYHNLRLDQIPFKRTIELRAPFQALPLIPYALLLPYQERINKKLFREVAIEHFGIPRPYMSIKKYPLKILPKEKIAYQRGLINEFKRSRTNAIHN